jgi:N-acetyl-gamma-glutamyl-phosphate reductase
MARVIPGAPEVEMVALEEAPTADLDVAFLCLPHGSSALLAKHLIAEGVRVVDLSADFRLREMEVYQQWYGVAHPAPELLKGAVYGLTEVARNDLRKAKLVANPGCYPTSVLLALYPLIGRGHHFNWVIIDAKSGVSGAGRTPSRATHFIDIADNLKPYKVGRVHRHLPEMEQVLAGWQADPPHLTFSPHLLPIPRGLLSTIYLSIGEGWSASSVESHYSQAYQEEPFVRLLPPGELATLAHVNNSNCCAIGWTLAEQVLVITSAIDNLLKGASGQAVQNMNAMFGLDETTGLLNLH